MDGVTKKVSIYVRDKGVSIASISDRTGISIGVLYPSLRVDPSRKLRADELLAVCQVLEVDPMQFYAPRKAV